MPTLTDKQISLLSWLIFGLVLIGLTISVSDAFLDTMVWQVEAGRSLSGPIEKPRSAPSTVDTSNWKTYRNEQYGFEVKYPSGWTLSAQSDNGLVISSFNIYPPQASLDSTSYIRVDAGPTLAHGMEFFDVVDTKVVRVGNVIWNVKYWEAGETGEKALTAGYYNGRTEYGVEAYYLEDQETLFEPVFNQILSTFRFIEPIDTSTWKTYRNAQHGFELKYPSTWFVYPDSIGAGLQSVDAKENLHGVGLPPNGEMWVEVRSGGCAGSQRDFVPSEIETGPRTFVLENTLCQNGFSIFLRLWDADPAKEQHEALLEAIAATLRKI